ncbi:DUF4231 domain-containing protein [Nocardia sp. NPDC059240]|uniref:DUF4231 domain-containing protein n=1 Tax=Nocardia sp. NPDC059240 TaxID=3346786 RepID=UPI0036817D35
MAESPSPTAVPEPAPAVVPTPAPDPAKSAPPPAVARGTRSSAAGQTNAMAQVIPWATVGPALRDFWSSTYAPEVAYTDRLTGRFRSWGQILRFTALAASAIVTGLAGFEGSAIRAATALAGGIAVIATGSPSIFRTDQRVATNRAAQQSLLTEGWQFVSGAGTYKVPPTPETATAFITNVEQILVSYTNTYIKTIDEPAPTTTPS